MPSDKTPIGTIETMEWGPPEAQSICLLFHASATGPKSFGDLGETLASEGYRAIAPGFDGYGRTKLEPEISDNVVGRNTVLAGQVFATVKARKRVVIGHSMGGLIALLAALDAANRQNLPDALVLYDPILHDLLDSDIPAHKSELDWDAEIIEAMGADIATGNAERGIARFIEAWNETPWQMIPDHIREILVQTAARLHSEAASLPGQDLSAQRLAGLEIPLLIVNGERSPAFCKLCAAQAAELIPNVQTAIAPGLGHMGLINKPDRIYPVLASFLNSLEN